MPRADARPAAVPAPAVVTKAVVRAAGRLQVSHKALARILGVSEATVSRMAAGSHALDPDGKAFELATLFIRLFRAVDALTSGDEAVAATWLRSENTALGAAPIALVQSVSGLVNVVAYLDARRALA
jgi:hypothetical protein